jgi:hypothetical protein
MFRPFRKREREALPPPDGTGQRRVLEYRRDEEEDEPRIPFWRDREGWKELARDSVAELIVGPLLVIAALWIWFRYFRG